MRAVLTAIAVLAALASPAFGADMTTAAAAWKAEDFVTAFEELKALAENEDPDALFLLGLMHDRGLGVPQNKAEAFFWYRLAAAKGHEVSRSALGAMRVLGSGAPKDKEKAAEWFRRAAERGNVAGQYNLAVAFHTGSGVSQNFERAAHWYRMAAERGLADAQFQLGSLYFIGQGVVPDYPEAYFWFTVAAERGRGDALEIRDLLAQLMSSAEIWTAEQRAAEWQPRTVRPPEEPS